MSEPASINAPNRRTVAIFALLGACACWSLSFPLMRALGLAQLDQFPECSSMFLSAWSMTLRFGIASLVLAVWLRRQLYALTRSELMQALGLGVFTGLGMVLQMDGLSYTPASTSAFITQGTSIFVPLTMAVLLRRLPSLSVVVAIVLVMSGVGVLAGLSFSDLRLGRGETETLLASMIFTAQIVWLERPAFAANHAMRMSTIAFAICSLVMLVMSLVTAPTPGHIPPVYTSLPLAGALLGLALICTFCGMLLMFAWQRHVGAVAAALIYCSEPIFASLLAFVLPALLSLWLGIAYANETFTSNLLIGGTLVLIANVVVLWRPKPAAG